jgi:hypothetical protein
MRTMRDCWVVEAALNLPAAPHLHIATTRWFDKILGNELKNAGSSKMDTPGDGGS